MFNLNLCYETVAPWQYGFQVPATPVMEGIVNFFHDLFFFISIIVGFVSYILWRAITLFNSDANKNPIIVTAVPTLEIVWTIIPTLILILIAIPSFSLIYSVDEIVTPLMTVKVIGHQWYWSYEILDTNSFLKDVMVDELQNITNKELNAKLLKDGGSSSILHYDSYMLTNDLIKNKSLRLLAVDNNLYIPVEASVRILTTSTDVIHSWAVPALGIKLDACPGRLNQTSVFVKRPGTFFGQCSEICGVNHGFMPIAVTALDVFGDFARIPLAKAEGITTLFGIAVKKRILG